MSVPRDPDLITSFEAARILGMTRAALVKPERELVLRPRVVGGRRLYSRKMIETYAAQRDAARARDTESDREPVETDREAP